ncbi:MAG: aminotransferase class V-fold PLP-dependent enzyme, partial [Gammaproteobacteria bacterium]|nr:alanine--glyoxylate aminotransferase family protein [Gemmatimonadota bacterium]NIU77239.1 aminotransferase class V-fold PLP-dependent enzyme [Gammaproteobacteria bacterium]NIY10846.1 aminotransferase class V-fold PLP-dependent enzyme [Gemmatimonadota bacterium]
PWGAVHSPEQVEEALAEYDADTVTICHSETSTGALNPVAELTAAAHAAGDVVVLVDAVSSMAGAPLETDGWAIDYVLTGSQKALALPPGLAFAVARETVLERARSKPDRGYYYDVLAFEKNLAKNQTPNTPAVSLVYALAAQLERIAEEGIEARWTRHAAMAQRTYDWVDERRAAGVPVGILAPDGFRSPTVTCVTLPEGVTGPGVVAALRDRGYTVAPGYGRLKESTIRIGHMGDHTPDTLDGLLETLTEVLT